MSTSLVPFAPVIRATRRRASFAAALLTTTVLAAPLAFAPLAFAEEPANDLGVVVISANRTPTDEAAVGSSVTVVTRAEIEKSGQVFVKDYLARVPGLGFSQTGGPGSQTTVDMRGMGASYVLVRIDGIDVADPTSTRTQAAIEHLELGDVERIEILRGSQSALYGGTAVAGVVDITTRTAAEKGIHHSATVGGGSYGTASGAYTLSAATDTTEASVSIQKYHTDGFSSADEHKGNPERDPYDSTTASVNAAWRISETFRVFTALRWSRWESDYDDTPYNWSTGTSRPADEIGARFHTIGEELGVRGGVDFSLLDGRLKSTLAVQHYDVTRDIRDSSPGRYEGRRTKLEYLGNFAVTEAIGLSWGVDHTDEHADVATAWSSLAQGITSTGVFGQASWKPLKGVTLTAALRDDHHSMFGDHPTHRITAAWEPIEATKLRASWGTGFRPPSIYELYAPSYGNVNLKPESSRSFDVGVDQRFWGGRASVSATWFHIDTEDLIDYDSSTWAYVQIAGTSRREGVELSGRLRARDDLTFDAAYTYTEARAPTGIRLVRVPRHKASLGAEWAVREDTTLSLRGTFVSDSVDTDYSIAGSPVRRLPDYALLDAGVSWKWNDHVALSLSGKNLFDRRYETIWGYGTAGRTVWASLKVTY